MIPLSGRWARVCVPRPDWAKGPSRAVRPLPAHGYPIGSPSPRNRVCAVHEIPMQGERGGSSATGRGAEAERVPTGFPVCGPNVWQDVGSVPMR
jgi:hypothetical protein